MRKTPEMFFLFFFPPEIATRLLDPSLTRFFSPSYFARVFGSRFQLNQKGTSFARESACLLEQGSRRITQVPRLQIKRTGLKADYQEILSVYVSY